MDYLLPGVYSSVFIFLVLCLPTYLLKKFIIRASAATVHYVCTQLQSRHASSIKKKPRENEHARRTCLPSSGCPLAILHSCGEMYFSGVLRTGSSSERGSTGLIIFPDLLLW